MVVELEVVPLLYVKKRSDIVYSNLTSLYINCWRASW